MNPKQQTFVMEYLVDHNATEAAKRAGYSDRVARQYGSKLLAKPDIQEAISRAIEEQKRRTGITADYVLTNLQRIAERCMCDETWDAAQANRSLELLGKHLKMWTDKVEQKSEGSMKMRFVWDDGDDDQDTV